MSQSVAHVTLPVHQSDDVVALVQRARQGEKEAYGELVEHYWQDLVALARGILATDLEVEDLVQEALIHAWSRLGTLRRPERFGAWIRRIVARRCLSRARRRRRSLELDETPAEVLDPSAVVDAGRLLSMLAPRQRAALYLTWIAGCSDREAGSILGIGAATVRVHRHRGLKRLRQVVVERG